MRPYRTAQNAVAGLVMTLVEITPQKEAQIRLHALTQAVAQSSKVLAVVDETGRFEYVNPGFSRMGGYSPKELIGQTAALLDGDRQRPGLARQLEMVLAVKAPWRGEIFYTKKNGETGQVWVSISPAINEVKYGYQAMTAIPLEIGGASSER